MVVCPVTDFCANAAVNASGVYTTTVPTTGPATTFVAFTTGAPGLVNEVADDVPCPVECSRTDATVVGTAFAVAPGATVTKNFALSPGGTISGVVLDAVTRAPVNLIRVRVFVRFNNRVQSATVSTDASGAFSLRGLGSGTYFAAISDAEEPPNYVREVFGGVPCLGTCGGTDAIDVGAPITVQAGAVTSGINFALQPGARISGTVRRTDTSAPLANVRVDAWRRVGSGLVNMATALTDASGAYELARLPEGAYAVATTSDFVDEVHGGVPCIDGCGSEQIAAGQFVQVPARGSVSGINFALAPGGTVTGRVTDALTGTPLVASVRLYRVTGTAVSLGARATSVSQGVFNAPGLTAGSYVAVAQAESGVSRLFGGPLVINPTTTELLAGARLTVTEGVTTPNIDFALGVGATIRGRVRQSPSLAPAVSAEVALFKNVGGGTARPVARATTDSAGTYTFFNVPAGLYQVATAAPRLANQVYNGIPCPDDACTPAFVGSRGTLVPATVGLITNNIDFTLGPATGRPGPPTALNVQNVQGGARFSWQAPEAGEAPTSYILEAGLTPGTTVASLPAASTSLFVPSIPPGVFFVRVRGVNGAGTGTPSSEVVLRVGAGGIVAPEPPRRLSPLVVDGRLTLTWRPPQRGPAPTSYQLEVGTAAGRSDIAVVPTPTATPLFQFTGVPPGVYFVRVRSVVGAVVGAASNDTMMVVGNVPAPPSEPSFLESTVVGNVVTLAWEAPSFGPVTDYVLEAGSQPDASNIAVLRLGTTATSITFPGVPPGRYFLRLRAVNARGLSPQSQEHEMVVP